MPNICIHIRMSCWKIRTQKWRFLIKVFMVVIREKNILKIGTKWNTKWFKTHIPITIFIFFDILKAILTNYVLEVNFENIWKSRSRNFFKKNARTFFAYILSALHLVLILSKSKMCCFFFYFHNQNHKIEKR